MTQSSIHVENGPGQAVRQGMNNALLALGGANAGAQEPDETYPFMSWADTASDVLKMRNAADTGWVNLFKLSTGEPLQVNLAGAVRLKGSLDASLGQLPSDPESGDMWRISVTGTLPAIGLVTQKDSIIYSPQGWVHEDHTDQVLSVAGLMGSISTSELFAALGLGAAATKPEGYYLKPGDAIDVSRILVSGTEIVDSDGLIDWQRLKGLPNKVVNAVTQITAQNCGSGSALSLTRTGSAYELKLTNTNCNCNCACNCDCFG